MNKYIKTFESYNQIEIFKNTNLSKFNNKIEGGFLTKQQAQDLQKEIESNYIDGDMMQHFNREKDDIRMKLFNYEHPIAQKYVNGIDVRIAEGLIRNKKKTYLLYANGEIIGEFYSVADIKKIVKFIEDNLIKNIDF